MRRSQRSWIRISLSGMSGQNDRVVNEKIEEIACHGQEVASQVYHQGKVLHVGKRLLSGT